MKYKKIFNKIESILLKVCVVSLLLIIGLQFLISNEDFSVFLNNTEDNSLNSSGYYEKGVLILRLESEGYEDVEVLVNGEVIANFNKKKEIPIDVYNNDLIEINGTKHLDTIKIKLVGISKNIIKPELNTVVTTSKSIELLGKVILN